MNDDELRTRLARLDPQANVPFASLTSRLAQDLLERTMTSTLTSPERPTERRTRRLLVVTTAAAVAAVGVTAAILTSQGADTLPAQKKTTLALTLPDPNAMSSCIMFDVAILKGFPVAFAGTVTAVADGTVSLDVTKWYVGGSAQVVTLTTPGDTQSISLDGVSFEKDKDYLVTASDGAVTSCGFSGEASPTLEQAFDEAFGG